MKKQSNRTKKPRIAYSYIRFSTKKQKKGDSLKRQKELAVDWCKRNDAILVEDYRDLGVSGFKGKNKSSGALGVFIDKVRIGTIEKVSFLLVEDFDRMSRENINLAMAQFLELINHGISIVTLTDGEHVFEEGMDNMFMELMYALLKQERANEESRTKSYRIKKSHASSFELAKKGRKNKLAGRPPSWMKRENGKYVLIPENVKTIKRIFTLVAKGLSGHKISQIFNEEKVPTFGRAKYWLPERIIEMVRMRSVLGEYVSIQRKGEVIKNYYPKAISEELFVKANRVRSLSSTPNLNKSKNNYPLNIFKGLMVGQKGQSYILRHTKKPKKTYSFFISRWMAHGLEKWCKWDYQNFKDIALTLIEDAYKIENDLKDSKQKLLEVQESLQSAELRESELVNAISKNFSSSLEKALRKVEEQIVELKMSLKKLQEDSPKELQQDIDWADTEKLRENILQTVKSIVICPHSRKFVVHMHNGSTCSYEEKDGKVVILSGTKAEKLLSDSSLIDKS